MTDLPLAGILVLDLTRVPSWKLRQAHALLLARGHGPGMEIAPSYLDVIRRATSTR